MAAAVVSSAVDQVRQFGEHPLAALIKFLKILGAVFLGIGVICGIWSYYLQAAVTTALNDEAVQIAQIANIFSNIKAPTFTPAPSGTAPLSLSLQGVQNFGANAWQDVQAAGADLGQIGAAIGTLGEDLATGVVDVAKALLAIIQNGPRMLWDGAVGVIGGGVAGILSWAFPYLVLIGAAMLGVGIVLDILVRGLSGYWSSTWSPAWKRSWARWSARHEARAERFFDKLLRNPPGEPTATFAAPPAPTPLAPAPPPPAGIPALEGDPIRGDSSPPGAPGGVPVPLEGESPAPPAASEPLPPMPPPLPPPGPPEEAPHLEPAPQGPTEEAEAQLAGDFEGRDLTEDEIQEAERRTVESDPDVVDTDRRVAILQAGLAD